MIGAIKNGLLKHKIKVTFIGGILVVASAYGTCSFDPDEDAIKDAVIKAEKATETDEKETTKEEAKADDKAEEKKEDEPKTKTEDKK
tara:strand:+ start:213 stop:473 length:261 start_codon:yes stop_codon:yes gene_type:complete